MQRELFICPVCRSPLSQSDQSSMRCQARHSFNIARQGYLSLVTSADARGDTRSMVEARRDFLARGVYDPIAKGLITAVGNRLDPLPWRGRLSPPPVLADLGGGTGWYARALLSAFPDAEGVLIDASVFAARVAAKAHPRLSVATADLWQGIPLADASVSVALNVFAPRNPAEIRRILAPGGVCLVVTPTPNHLQELRAILPMLTIEADKERHLLDRFSHFRHAGAEEIEYVHSCDRGTVAQILAMGPSAFHRGKFPEPTLDQDSYDTTISVTIHRFHEDRCGTLLAGVA